VFLEFQNLVMLAIYVLFAGLKVWAFVDVARRPQQAFPAVDRQTKTLWLILTGIAALTGLAPLNPVGLIGIAGVVIALLYLFEIRPRIKEITGR
jgi:hypothetical protein